MFWGVLIGVSAAGVFGASIMMDVDLMAMYTEMGIGVGTAAVIFTIGAGVVSAIDYSRKRKAY